MLLGVSIVVFYKVRAILATREQVRQNMGLEEPVIVQYGLFLADALREDLGDSIIT